MQRLDERGQRSMARLIQADRKATVTQTTSIYNVKRLYVMVVFHYKEKILCLAMSLYFSFDIFNCTMIQCVYWASKRVTK